MKKTLFALLACAAVMPAMAADYTVGYAYFDLNDGQTNKDLYKFYAIYQDTTDIGDVVSTIKTDTFADFKTTYGEGLNFEGAEAADGVYFESLAPVVTSPTDFTKIWGVSVYENGEDALFEVLPVSDFVPASAATGGIAYIYFDSWTTPGEYVAFNSGSPATPEPATATLSLLALAGLASRRRRK